MSQIRKSSLKATWWIYLGFLIGALNVYLLTHNDWFTPEQYGLTTSLREISLLICAFSTFGVTSYLIKFFPYYQDHTLPRDNDALVLALKVAMGGFIITCLVFYLMQPLIIRKFSTNSKMLVEYFYYTLPMAFTILLFNILESYSYAFQKGVLTSFLRECALRVFTLAVIVLKVLNIINFETFVFLFILQYGFIVLLLAFILHKNGQLWLSFKKSRVTHKFRKKIFSIMLLSSFVVIVSVLRSVIDTLVLASKLDLAKAGIFAFSIYLVSLLQAPYRSIIAITIPVLSRAWKDKDHHQISKIYKRSSINLLCFALFTFFCIWLNYEDAIRFFNINPEYLEGKWVFFIVGMVTIIEMGTGVNSQIIGTSVYWRFELWTSVLLTALIIPLSYILTVSYGIIGPALANLVSFTVYNTVRYLFLWKKFRLQPFTIKTLEIIIFSFIGYITTYYIFNNIFGLSGLIGRTLFFIIFFIIIIYSRNISPDVRPILTALNKRIKKIIDK